MLNIYRFSAKDIESAVASLKEFLVDTAGAFQKDVSPLPTDIPPELKPLDDIKAVLFDIYGTLVVSAAGEVGSAKETTDIQQEEGRPGPKRFSSVLEGAGFIVKSSAGQRAEQLYFEGIEKCHSELKEKSVLYPEVNIIEIWHRLLTILAEEGLIREKNESHSFATNTLYDLKISIKAAFFHEVTSNPVSSMPKAKEIVEALSENNLSLGIVSNAQFYTPLVLEALFGKSPERMGFSPELCTWSWKLREAKPSPGLFEIPLKRLSSTQGISPAEVLYIGNDMRNDILPAKNAGCKAVLFAGDRRSLRLRTEDDALQALRPDGLITDLSQLIEILPGLELSDRELKNRDYR
ncbi:MAG: HAD family hydrolase [Spirochaetaceae bacterium]